MKTLAEIAIDAGLVTKADAAKAGRLAEERKQPLVVMLIRELQVDELALVAALRKQTRVPLLDPASVQTDPEATREVPRDISVRLCVLPLGMTTEGKTRVMRVAMADPTDSRAIAELEALTGSEIDVSALPLSAIEELVAQSYRGTGTAVTARPLAPGTVGVSPRGRRSGLFDVEGSSEVSVTAQIPLSALHQQLADGVDLRDLADRLDAVVQVLVSKGLLTEAELSDALRKPKA